MDSICSPLSVLNCSLSVVCGSVTRDLCVSEKTPMKETCDNMPATHSIYRPLGVLDGTRYVVCVKI